MLTDPLDRHGELRSLFERQNEAEEAVPQVGEGVGELAADDELDFFREFVVDYADQGAGVARARDRLNKPIEHLETLIDLPIRNLLLRQLLARLGQQPRENRLEKRLKLPTKPFHRQTALPTALTLVLVRLKNLKHVSVKKIDLRQQRLPNQLNRSVDRPKRRALILHIFINQPTIQLAFVFL